MLKRRTAPLYRGELLPVKYDDNVIVEILTVSVNTCKHVTITFNLLNEMMYTVKVNILNFLN